MILQLVLIRILERWYMLAAALFGLSVTGIVTIVVYFEVVIVTGYRAVRLRVDDIVLECDVQVVFIRLHPLRRGARPVNLYPCLLQ